MNASTQMDIFEELFDDGEENEGELIVDYLDKIQDTVTWSTDWTVETINKQIEKNLIDLNPNFQRRDAWNSSKKSKLIESIMFGFPIPQIVLAENKEHKGKFIVVDGKQRLTTINQYIGDQFALELPQNGILNGLRYSDLDEKYPDYAQAFQNQTIRSVVLKNWATENFLYALFYRLNTGSLPLSPQELRSALKPGNLINALIDYTESSPGIKRIFKQGHPDPRMKDVELLLRYIAFEVNIQNYDGNFKEFLDKICDHFNKNWESKKSEVDSLCRKFENVVEASYSIFGEDSAFKVYSADGFERRFNRAVFDIQAYYLGHPLLYGKTFSSDEAANIVNGFCWLCVNRRSFEKAVSSNTNNIRNFSTRFTLFGEKMEEVLAIPGLIPPNIRSLYNAKYKDD